MAEKRTGTYGSYYGSRYNSSTALNSTEMSINVVYIYRYLTAKGWTKNAIAGMLGNMEAESSLNPGRWQSDNVGNTSGGYGLVQWTPATNYLQWCDTNGYSDPSQMDHNLERIIYELENGLQWIATEEYNLSFLQFSKSIETPEYLAVAFLKNYERAGVEVVETRKANARKWYDYITNATIVPSGPSLKKNKKNFNFIIFNRRRRYF